MDATTLIVLKFAAVLLLVFLNGFFVAAEFALVKVRDTQLVSLANKGQRRARMARQVVKNLDASLSACQLGITLASLGLGWIGEAVFTEALRPLLTWMSIESEQVQHTLGFLLGFSAITFLHITAGEQAPKMLAIQQPLPTSLWVAYPLAWFHRASYPFIWALNYTSLWLLRSVGIKPVNESELNHSEEELRLFFTASQKHAGGTTVGRDLVLNALDLQHRRVRDVMRPRQEITGFDTQAGIAECLEVAERTRYSRFPLCEGGDPDKTLGVVHVKDLFAQRLKTQKGADLLPSAKKMIYVPETARLEKLLTLFLDRRLHLAIVVDEYGGTVGLVTLENILEELVGQIQDEFDQEKPLVEKTGDNVWELSGALPLHELSELIGQPLIDEGVTTVNGLVTQRHGGFPKEGDVLRLGNFELKVEARDGLRVTQLRLAAVPAPPASPEAAPSDA